MRLKAADDDDRYHLISTRSDQAGVKSKSEDLRKARCLRRATRGKSKNDFRKVPDCGHFASGVPRASMISLAEWEARSVVCFFSRGRDFSPGAYLSVVLGMSAYPRAICGACLVLPVLTGWPTEGAVFVCDARVKSKDEGLVKAGFPGTATRVKRKYEDLQRAAQNGDESQSKEDVRKVPDGDQIARGAARDALVSLTG
ncbi:hypothetical protein K466DRAFT_607250 [Polyporus arcularius HHB13444]|uniref:Uncharacterized protein n=1 Tax=Polyporus arcularius HHB13444 TaxID=1314778 RepID=A0A5C3NKZ4_9APHY|nr:hypothetical protein K466DRAFT_607250 [Polyporus arcularius HHB13444]